MTMFRLALHWQILIGMIAGTLLGVGLNAVAGRRHVEVSGDLPKGIVAAEIDDSASESVIRYRDADGETHTRIIDPTGDQPERFRTLQELEETDPVAATIYRRHGRSLAKRAGVWFERLGGLFLRLLKMVAVPLIVTSLASGILGLATAGGVGRMFGWTAGYYLSTSLLAILTGLLIVNLIGPGLGEDPKPRQLAETITEGDSLGSILFQQVEALIPSNPAAALVEPNFLSIIAFTIAFALFAALAGEKTARRVEVAALTGFDVMMAMTLAIIRLAPIGVFFLIAHITATQGISVFQSLAWYMLAVALALLVHATVTLPVILRLVAGRHPLKFVQAMSPALLTAFSSASSNGTLPLTISSAEKRAGISNRTASFVLPLGATINMDGTALYEAVAVLFIANMHFGHSLPVSQQIVVAVTALLASVGAAGIPHAGLIMMAIILQAVNLPLEMQGIILAVDRVLDMARTAVNVWSDSCGCAVVETLENRAEAAGSP